MYPSVSSSLAGRETAGTGISNVADYLSISASGCTNNNASQVSSTLYQQVNNYTVNAKHNIIFDHKM